MTRLEKEILTLAKKYPGHHSADDLFKLAQTENLSVSLASVYRVLGSLSEKGLLRRISNVGEKDVYDLFLKDHGHLVCKCCGKITDFEIEKLSSLIEESLHLSIEGYDLAVNYVCDECQKHKRS